MFKRSTPKKPVKTEPYKSDRRDEKKDRRSFGLSPKFPFITTKGKIIQCDRRSRPERRIANIQVETLHSYIDDEKFKKGTKT